MLTDSYYAQIYASILWQGLAPYPNKIRLWLHLLWSAPFVYVVLHLLLWSAPFVYVVLHLLLWSVVAFLGYQIIVEYYIWYNTPASLIAWERSCQ